MCNVHNPYISSPSQWTDERACDLTVSMKGSLDGCKSCRNDIKNVLRIYS